MTDVVVRPALGHARHHRQDRLLAVERLDLAFLVDAKDKRPVGRREVKADDIAHLVDEQRIARQLEGLAAVRLQAERRPHPADRRMRKAGLSRHRTDRPVRRVGRRGAQRPLDHGGNLIVVDGSRPARASLVEQALDSDPSGSGGATCQPYARARPSSARDRLAGEAVRTSQNDPAPLRQRSGDAVATDLPLQIGPLLRTQHQRRDRPASRKCLRHQRSPSIARALIYNEMNFSSR